MVFQLTSRQREILDLLVADYIASAAPVGSRTIAKCYPGRLSPASIRNVMSDLTDMGLLAQPHISAGRIPTTEGMRYYAETLLKRRELTEDECTIIRQHCDGDEQGISAVLQRTTRMLAAVSHYAGLVLTPGPQRVLFKQIEFIRLGSRRLLGIFVSQDGLVQNRLIELTEEMTFTELERIANYCNRSLTGLTLDEAREKIERELADERADYDRILRRAMVYSQQVLGDVPAGDLVFDGELQLLDVPEFHEAETFRRLIEALEEKRRLSDVLARCSEAEGVQIFIGADAELEQLDAVAMVGAPYMRDGNVIGVLGVIGPARMDYSHVVPIVDFTAKVIGDALDS